MYLISVQLNCVVLPLWLIVYCCFCKNKLVVTVTKENSLFAESIHFAIVNLVSGFHVKMANHELSLS